MENLLPSIYFSLSFSSMSSSESRECACVLVIFPNEGSVLRREQHTRLRSTEYTGLWMNGVTSVHSKKSSPTFPYAQTISPGFPIRENKRRGVMWMKWMVLCSQPIVLAHTEIAHRHICLFGIRSQCYYYERRRTTMGNGSGSNDDGGGWKTVFTPLIFFFSSLASVLPHPVEFLNLYYVCVCGVMHL